MSAEMNDRFELAKLLAQQGGRSTLEFFQQPGLQVEKKGDHSPVTIADRNAEKLIRENIADQFPNDAIVGEEFGETAGDSGVRWILDPIDGTKSFICGVPLFGTIIGVEQNGKSQIGAIYFPALDVGIYGRTGQPTVYGTASDLKTASVSQTDKLSDAVFVTSASKTFAQRNAAEVYRELESRCYVTRTWGDCYGYYLVATGRVDLMIDARLSIWDAAAVAPILAGAGGSFVDWAGEARIDPGEAIGATPAILDSVLEITRPFAGKFD